MKRPAELYAVSPRRYDGLPELTYPFHDRDILVTACGRLCLHCKRINISSGLAGQRLGIKEDLNSRYGTPVRLRGADLSYTETCGAILRSTRRLSSVTAP